MANIFSTVINKIFGKKTPAKKAPVVSAKDTADNNFFNSISKTSKPIVSKSSNKDQEDNDFFNSIGKKKPDISSLEGKINYAKKTLKDNGLKTPPDTLTKAKNAKGLVHPGSDFAYDKSTAKSQHIEKVGNALGENKLINKGVSGLMKTLSSLFNSVSNPLTKATKQQKYSNNPIKAFTQVLGNAAKNSVKGIKAPWTGDESNMGSGHKALNNLIDNDNKIVRGAVSTLSPGMTYKDLAGVLKRDKASIAKAKTKAGIPGFLLDMITPVPNMGIPEVLKATKALSKGSKGLNIAKEVMGATGRTEAVSALEKVGLVTEGNIKRVQDKVVKIKGGYDYKGIQVGGVTVIKPETVMKLADTKPLTLLRKGLEAVKNNNLANKAGDEFGRAFKEGKNSDIMALAKQNPADAYNYVAHSIAESRANALYNKGKLNMANKSKEVDEMLTPESKNKIRATLEEQPTEVSTPTTVKVKVNNPEYDKLVENFKAKKGTKYNEVDSQIKRLNNTIKDSKDNVVLAKAKLDMHKLNNQKEIMDSVDNFTSTDFNKQLENSGIDSDVIDKVTNSSSVYSMTIQETEKHLKNLVDKNIIKIHPDEISDYAVRFKTAADKTLKSVREHKTLGKYADDFLGTSTIKTSEIKDGLGAAVSGPKPSDLFKAAKETATPVAPKVVKKELTVEEKAAEKAALDLKHKELNDSYKAAEAENAAIKSNAKNKKSTKKLPKQLTEAEIAQKLKDNNELVLINKRLKGEKVKNETISKMSDAELKARFEELNKANNVEHNKIPKALTNKIHKKPDVGYELYDMKQLMDKVNNLKGRKTVVNKVASDLSKEADRNLIRKILKKDEFIADVEEGVVNKTNTVLNVKKSTTEKSIWKHEDGLNIPHKDITKLTNAQKMEYLKSLNQKVRSTIVEGPEARTAHIKALREDVKPTTANESNILGDKLTPETTGGDIRAPKAVTDKSGKVSYVKDNPSMGGKFDKNAEVDPKRIEGMESRVKILEDAGVDIKHLPQDTIKAIKNREVVTEQSFRELNKQITDTFETPEAIQRIKDFKEYNKLFRDAERDAIVTPDELTKLNKMRGGVSGSGKEQIAYVKELVNRVNNVKTHGEYADLAREIYKYKQAKKFAIEGNANDAQKIYDDLFGVKSKDMASTGEPRADGSVGYKWEGTNPEIKTLDFNINGTIVKAEASSNSKLVQSLLKALREMPAEARAAIGELRILDGKLSIPQGAIPASANGKQVTFFSNKATTALSEIRNLTHVIIHESIHAGENAAKRDKIYKDFNGAMEGLSSAQKTELHALLKDSTSATINTVKLEAVKGGQISSYPKLFSDVRKRQETIAEIGAAFFGKNKPLADKLNELMPGMKEQFLEMLKATPKDDISNLVPKHIDGRADLIAQMDRTQNVIRALEGIAEPLEKKVFSLTEQRDYLKKVLLDDDFAVSEFQKAYKGSVEQFKELDQIVFKKEFKYPEYENLNDAELEVFEFIKKQFGTWGTEEQINVMDRYVTHMLVPTKENKMIKGIHKDTSLGSPKNIYSEMRKDSRTIDEINENMADKFPDDYAATPGQKLPTYVEANLSRIYLQRGLYHEKFMWEKTMADDTLKLWGEQLHSLKQFEDMGHKEFADLLESKGIKYNDAQGGVRNLEDLHKEYTGVMYREKFESGNYVLLNTGEDFVESKSSTLKDGVLDKSIHQTNARKAEVFNMGKLDTANEPLQQLIGDTIRNPFIEVSMSDISVGGLYEKNMENLHFMRKDIYKHYQDVMQSQGKKQTNLFLKIYDGITGVFKTSATVVNPSFHTNNAIGNVLNSYLGIGSDVMSPELHYYATKAAKENAEGNYMGKTLKRWREIMHEEGVFGGEFFGKDTTKFLNRQSEQFGKKGNPVVNFVKKNNPITYGGAVGKFLEDENKALNFFAHVKNGKSIEEAADLTKKFTFDYSDLTKFEMSTMKRLMPFYTWLRKNMPLQMEQVLLQPEKYARMNQGVKDLSQPETPEQYALRPDYLKNAIHLGDGKYRNVNLPSNDLQKLGSAREWFSGLNPILKAIIEVPMTNTNMYYQSKIKKSPGDKVPAPTLLKLFAKSTPKGKMIDPIAKYMYKSFLPAADNYGNLIEMATGSASDEQRVKAQGFLEGSRKYVTDQKSLETSGMYTYLDQLNAIVSQAKKEGYIPDKVKASDAISTFLDKYSDIKNIVDSQR